MESNVLNGVILKIWTTYLKTPQKDVGKLIIIHLNSIKINLYYYSFIASELNDIITVSLIDDELVDIKKENEDYENLNVVEPNENNEEEPPNESLNGNSSKQLFYIFLYNSILRKKKCYS